MVGSPCSPRDSQESSPTPQFKSINSVALSLLYGTTLISIHDYRKTIALTRWTCDYGDPWRQGLDHKRVPEGMLKRCSGWGQQRPEWSLVGVWAPSPGAGQGERCGSLSSSGLPANPAGTLGRVLTSGLSRELCLLPAGEPRLVMFNFCLFIDIVDVPYYVSGVQHSD